MKIKNINGTSDNSCICGSWLSHWCNFSGQRLPKTCPVKGCQNTDLVGAHVQKGGHSTDQNWYICPLCKAHNNKTNTELDVLDDIILVSANKSKTCEK